MIDAFASRSHFLDHAAPVWCALPEEARGTFWVPSPQLVLRAKARGVDAKRGSIQDPGLPTLVASHEDLEASSRRRPIVYLEHGSGQTYPGDPKTAEHPSYSGGRRREQVALFLVPNETVAARCDAPAAVVGCPRLDALWLDIAWLDVEEPPRALGITWHWDAWLCSETRSAYSAWKSMVRQIADVWPGPVLGHAHPRQFAALRREYEARGIEPVAELDDLLARCEVLTFDNTSAGYEAAALGIPTVVLNAPWYRTQVSHGLRFWDLIPGPLLDPAGDGGVEDAEQVTMAAMLAGEPRWRDHSAAVAEQVYPSSTRGCAAQLAATAIMEAFA